MTFLDSKQVSEHYQGEKGEQYVHRLSDANSWGYELNYRWFKPYLKSTDVVLDFGCGNGGMLRLIKMDVAGVDGLEVNPTAAAIARQSGTRIFESIEEIQKCHYDVVVSNSVLEHVRDVCSTLEALRQVIKPGGLFVTKLPIDDARAAYQRGWSRDDIDHHLQTWTPRLFANVLYESGYEVKECRIITSAWHPRLFWTRRLRLHRLAFWAFAVVKRRRVFLAVAST